MVFALLPLAAALLALNPHLEEGQRLYEQLHYPEAAARLRLAVEVPSSTDDERARSFDLLARALVAQGQVAEATRVYGELLARQPHAPAPTNVAPKVRQAFDDAKRRLYPPDHVTLERAPAPPGRVGADLVDPWGATAAVVLVELPAQAPPRETPVPGAQRHYEAPLSPHVPARLEARRPDGRILAQLGSADTPLLWAPTPFAAVAPVPEVAHPATPRGPLRWPRWLVAGTAAAALAAGVGLAVSSGGDSAAAERAAEARRMHQLDARAHDKAVAANVLVAVAAAGGLTAGALFFSW